MSVYMIVAVTKNDNPEDLAKYQRYVDQGNASVEKYQVEAVAVSEAPRLIEGALPGQKIVVLKFRDQAHFDAWYNSEEYQRVLPLRKEAGKTAFAVTVEGLD